MSDNQNPKALSGVRQAWSNPKSRKGILLTAAIVGTVIVVAGISLKSKQGPNAGISNNAKLMAPPPVTPDVTAQVSSDYQKMVITKDNERADKAAKSNLDMALPQVAGLGQGKADTVVVVKPQAPASAATAPAAPTAPVATGPNVAQINANADAAYRKQMEQEVRSSPAYQVAGAFMTSALKTTNSAQNSGFSIILAPTSTGKNPDQDSATGAAGGKSGSANAVSANAANTANAAPPVSPATVIIGAGQALYATMDTAINTDNSGPVVATIRQGKYSGAKIIGVKSLEYDSVVLKFNVMSLPAGGPAIPIQAFAINLGDVDKFGTTGLQGSTDYHIVQRYVLPAVLAFAQTYGFAASVSGATTTSTTTSTTQQTTPLSNRDRALVAIGGALAPVAADLAKSAARPVTIRMDANTEIGVLFMQDVTDKNAKAAADRAAQGINVGVDMVSAPLATQMPSNTSGPTNSSAGAMAPRQGSGGFGGNTGNTGGNFGGGIGGGSGGPGNPSYSAPYRSNYSQ